MRNMEHKNTVVGTRVTPQMAEKLREIADKGQYLSPSEFVREAIREKIRREE